MEPGTIDPKDRLFKLLLKCQRNHYKPDLHSFLVNIKNGRRAYVEGQVDGVYLEWDDGKGTHRLHGNAVAIANKLDRLGADYSTVDM